MCSLFEKLENMKNHNFLIFQAINTIIYSTFLIVLCVYGPTLKSIDQNYQRQHCNEA